jgi:MFS family permease
MPVPSFRERWGPTLALIAAFLGWLFDGFEMGIFALVARAALGELLGPSATEADIGRWNGVVQSCFLVGAAAGGVLFGWLGDRIGRVRAMALSILTYSLCTGLCGLAGSALQIAVYRFIAALGMGGEWALGVALVMEVWPNQSRGWLAGVIGAASNVGFAVVAVIGLVLNSLVGEIRVWFDWLGVAPEWTAWLVGPTGWRLLMFAGATPAVLTFLVRLFVPESAKWEAEERAGATSHWATADLLGVLLGAAGACVIIVVWAEPYSTGIRVLVTLAGLIIAALGCMYPVIRYLQRAHAVGMAADGNLPLRRMILGACLSGVALLGTWGSITWAPVWVDQMVGKLDPSARFVLQFWSASGAVLGTVLAAQAGHRLGRRITYIGMCLTALGATYLLFLGTPGTIPTLHTIMHRGGTDVLTGAAVAASQDLVNVVPLAALLARPRPEAMIGLGWTFLTTAFFAGCFVGSFYGWLALYLPELFPTRVRSICQGFSYNFGRILAAIGTLQTGNLFALFDNSYSRACVTISLVYLLGIIVIWWAPETKGKPLPD